MARFLLTMLMVGGLVRVSRQGAPVRLMTDAEAVAAWQVLSPDQQQQTVGRLWFEQMAAPETRVPTNIGWTEIDLALEFHSRQRTGIGLQRIWYGYGETASLAKVLSNALMLVASSTDILQADTWYSFERYCDLLRAYSPNLIGMTSYGDSLQFAAGNRILNATNMDATTWQSTYGSLVAAWLTGTGRWLGRVEVALKDGRLVAFQRPEKTRATQFVALPADTLRFLPNGQIVVRTIWQAAEMRELVRQIAALETRDRSTMTFRLDPAAFRLALRRGATAAELAEAFASRGFPLPADAEKRIKLWESRAGRFRIYDQVAAIEFGDDLAQREVESAAGLGQRQAYPVSSRCSLLLDPAAVPDIVESLQRRGYIPKVLP